MGKIAILPKESVVKEVVSNESLPAFYMSDFSMAGLLVGKFDLALQILQENEFKVMEISNRFEIAITGADQVIEIVDLLRRNRIECGFNDIVDQVYQG